jgi:hypothetical protein
MESYRLYCLDSAGRIALAEWLDASSDEDAIQQVKVLKDGARKCELWQHNRLVAQISGQESDLTVPPS